MNIDIEKINTFERESKLNTMLWRIIYEVIEEAYFEESDIFPDDFIKSVRIMQMKLNLYHLMSKIT